MKKWLALVGALATGLSTVWAGSASYGIRWMAVSWKEKELYSSTADASGMAMGPILNFRFGEDTPFGLGAEATYGSLDDMDRADVDVQLNYEVADFVSVFLAFRYSWYEYDPKEDLSQEKKLAATMVGAGPGIKAEVPLADSGFFVFAGTRVLPVNVDSDVPEASDTAVLWMYELGLAFAQAMDFVSKDSAWFVSLGYRQQQIKGSDMDERVRAPFLEIGFKQEF